MSQKPIWEPALLKDPHQVADKASRVRDMFNAIAARYERTNTICSGGRDAYWRKRAVQLADVRSKDDVLDIACGTGDLARALAEKSPKSVTACDFAHEMLVRAVATSSGIGRWVEADALKLPFLHKSFSLITCAFGIRNFVNLEAGLVEMLRVLRPGGRIVILEFSRPESRAFRMAYELYAMKIMPWAASHISGDRTGAYRYLPRSVVSFLDAPQMVDQLKAVGFEGVTATPLTFGVVHLYGGWKPNSE